MATRGQIAYLANPNTIFSIYNHYDAYPEHLNKVLTTHFNSDEKASNLVMDGNDIRFIDDDGTIDRFDKGGAKQIKGEEPEELFTNLYDHSDSAAANYVYVWLEDKWITLPMNKGREYFIGTLLDQIRKIEPTMENKDKMEEGYYGTSNVESYIQALGYDSFEDFFNDNPGAEYALMTWMEKVPDFRKILDQQGLLEAKEAKEEIDENFIHQMKYRAGIIK
jgi:hypothetical protein